MGLGFKLGIVILFVNFIISSELFAQEQMNVLASESFESTVDLNLIDIGKHARCKSSSDLNASAYRIEVIKKENDTLFLKIISFRCQLYQQKYTLQLAPMYYKEVRTKNGRTMIIEEINPVLQITNTEGTKLYKTIVLDSKETSQFVEIGLNEVKLKKMDMTLVSQLQYTLDGQIQDLRPVSGGPYRLVIKD